MLNVVAMDVTDAESVRNAATQLKDVAIDVLINSAGIVGAPGQRAGKHAPEFAPSSPMGAVRTGLHKKSNRPPPCRIGNWKIASRDWPMPFVVTF